MLNAVDALMSAWAGTLHTGVEAGTEVDRAVLAGPVSVAEALSVYIGCMLNASTNTVKGSWSVTALLTSVVAWAGVQATVCLTPVHLTDALTMVVAVCVVLTVKTVEDPWSITCLASDIALTSVGAASAISVPVILTDTESGVGVTEGVLGALIALMWLRGVAAVTGWVAESIILRAVLNVVPVIVADTESANV